VKSKKKTDEDIRFERMRWGWIILAVGAVGIYLATSVDLNAFRRPSTKDSITEVVNVDVGTGVDVEDEEDEE
jgi:hypothetical protein